MKRFPGHAEAMNEAIDAKKAGLKHKDAEKLLDAKGLPSISRIKYKNTLPDRTKAAPPRTPQESFLDLMQALHQQDFRVMERDRYEFDDAGNPRQRILQQVVFTSPTLIALARRFGNRFALVVDATFNTNRLNLLLTVVTTVTNTVDE